MTKLLNTDFAWFAGILEIRGKFVTKKNLQRATPQTVMYVETSNLVVVNRLCALTGIKPSPIKQIPEKEFDRKGCNEHCPEKHIHVADTVISKPTQRWPITGAGVVVVLHNTLPYFSDDNMDVFLDKLILTKNNTPLSGQGSSMTRSSIRRLSLLGWKLPKEYQAVMQ